MTDKELVKAASDASKNAYSPYSRFPVGAALMLSDGTVITGCNVENASYGLTNCAERTAIFTAIASGRKDFVKMAIYASTDEFVSPCGACRQVMFEFAPEMTLLLSDRDLNSRVATVKELLPFGFGSTALPAKDNQ